MNVQIYYLFSSLMLQSKSDQTALCSNLHSLDLRRNPGCKTSLHQANGEDLNTIKTMSLCLFSAVCSESLHLGC